MHVKTNVLPVIAIVLVAFIAVATAQQLPPLQVEKYKLPNGLEVILHEDHTIPTVTVNVMYHVGSKNEKPGKTGYAHLFEHMMFEGTEHYSGDYSEPFDRIGGVNNAYTSEDVTNYYETVPSNYFEMAMWLESDRMGYLLPAMTQEKLDIQRDVVKNERRQRLDNEPYAKVYEIMLSALYPKEHPYSWSVIGSMEDLSTASVDDISEFFRMYYAPGNASLVIAGDFDPAEAKRLVEKYFAPIPAGPSIDRIQSWVPKLDGVKRLVIEDAVSLPRFYCQWPTPASYAPGDAEADLLANVLASGKTSRLYEALVYDQQIAQDVRVNQSSNELCSSFDIQVTAREGHTLEEIERAVDAILKDVREKGITLDELKQAQNGYEAGFVRSLQTAAGRAGRLNSYNVMLGDPDRFQWDLDRYTTATVADVNRFAKDYLSLDQRLIAYAVPQGDLAASGENPDRTQEPPAGPDPSFAIPAFQQTTLSNGMPLYLIERRDLPLVQINLVMKNGMANDPANLPGLAAITADLLDEGTKTRSALEISETAKALGASLGTNAGFDNTNVNLNILKKNLDPALELMADVVLNPVFKPEELDRKKKSYLGSIQQEDRQPFQTAIKAYYKLLYGAGHPYSQAPTGHGTVESVNAITRDDIVRYYESHYSPSIAAFIVVGDITMAEAEKKLERAFKSWSSKPVTLPTINEPEPLKATKIVIVDKPNAPQSVIIAGHVGISRTDPDYLPCEVLNNVLGGTFTSRMNTNLREEKGYTYGAGTAFVDRRAPGPFLAYTMVQTEVTDESITEIIKELRDVTGPRPLTADELKMSKDNLVKSYPQNFETYGDLAGLLNEMYAYDLPADDWTTYVERIKVVDQAAVTNAAKQHIHPDELLIMVVGDRQKIEPELKKLSIGEVSVANISDL